MTVTLIYKDIEKDSAAGQVLREWIVEQITNKQRKNISPLRYVDSVTFEEEEKKCQQS